MSHQYILFQVYSRCEYHWIRSQTLGSRSCYIFSSTVAISGEHVTKLVPKLSPVEECVDVPKVSALINLELCPNNVGAVWRQFPQPMFVSGDLHEGEGEPAHDPKADHKEVVLHPHWGVWPCLNHSAPSLALFEPSWYVTTGGFGSVQSSLVLLEPPWHVTAVGIASTDIYHYITSEGYGLALTITSWPLPTFLKLVSPTCILKTPAHHLTTNDGKIFV